MIKYNLNKIRLPWVAKMGSSKKFEKNFGCSITTWPFGGWLTNIIYRNFTTWSEIFKKRKRMKWVACKEIFWFNYGLFRQNRSFLVNRTKSMSLYLILVPSFLNISGKNFGSVKVWILQNDCRIQTLTNPSKTPKTKLLFLIFKMTMKNEFYLRFFQQFK